MRKMPILHYTFSKPASGSPESPSSGGWFKIFTVAAYRPYFDVDTSDVLERIKDSLLPFNGSFNEKTASNPDLYGPFWICTTLIFVAASIGTFVTYLAHKLQHKEWNYDINLVTWSAGVFYGYVLVVPLCLYVILKYFSAPSTLVQLFCLYGYSLFVFMREPWDFRSMYQLISPDIDLWLWSLILSVTTTGIQKIPLSLMFAYAIM
ncbi:putative Yip1 domain, protein Yip5/YIPF1/YIPF2 [Helianthus annuus]|nr:putative Yip1 domain, protein Yip5/YIPF1/YIPF2 [Helianthus annuus]